MEFSESWKNVIWQIIYKQIHVLFVITLKDSSHENISVTILPLPLIQEEQLSVTGERMCTKYW